MTSLFSITIVLILLSNFSSVLSTHFSQEKYLTNFTGGQPTLHRYHHGQVVKRQSNDESTPTPVDSAICDAQIKDVECSAGIQQGLVEAFLSCNRSIEEAQRDANSCAKGEGGQFCGSLWELHRIRAWYIEGNCSRVLTANSCPSNCRSLLEDFRSTLGCCINAYVNGTGISYRSYSLDYRVWNLCNVPLPPAACGNGPTINPPDNVQNCTNEDLFNKYYVENLCLPEQRQAYFDVLGTSVCGNVAPNSVEDACSVNINGVPCGALYYRSWEDLTRLDLACRTSSISCTSNCRDEITAAKNRNGCCLRSVWFNSIPALSSSVLRSCDIDLPGTCEGVIGSSVSIMKENYITLIVTGLMCLQLLMVATCIDNEGT
jgi:hypothetical protein